MRFAINLHKGSRVIWSHELKLKDIDFLDPEQRLGISRSYFYNRVVSKQPGAFGRMWTVFAKNRYDPLALIYACQVMVKSTSFYDHFLLNKLFKLSLAQVFSGSILLKFCMANYLILIYDHIHCVPGVSGLGQKYAFIKKSTIFTLSL